MAVLGPTVPIGRRHTRVVLQNEGPPAPDGAGGFLASWIDLPPPADAQVSPAAPAGSEHLAAGAAAASSATLLVTIPYRSGVSTATRVVVGGRLLYVTGTRDVDERHVELELTCEERVG